MIIARAALLALGAVVLILAIGASATPHHQSCGLDGRIYHLTYLVDESQREGAAGNPDNPERYPAMVQVREIVDGRTQLVVMPFQGWWRVEGNTDADAEWWVRVALRLRYAKQWQESR